MAKSKNKSTGRSLSRLKWKDDEKQNQEKREKEIREQEKERERSKSVEDNKEQPSRSKSLTAKKSGSNQKKVSVSVDSTEDGGAAAAAAAANEDRKSASRGKDPEKKSDSKEKPKDRSKEAAEASVFEVVVGAAQPAQTGVHGIKNKMKWKIDVEPVDVNGDQKLTEIVAKVKVLRKKHNILKKTKRSTRKHTGDAEALLIEEIEEEVFLCGRILQLIKLHEIVDKEVSTADQEILKSYCRAGSDEDKAEPIIDKISTVVLSSIVAKNDMCRTPTIPGQLRMFAVDEKIAKVPMIGLLSIRKDLLYIAWTKGAEKSNSQMDATWTNMITKKTNTT